MPQTVNGFPVLRMTTAAATDEPPKRVPLFYIDDTEFTMLAEPRTNQALKYLRLQQESGMDAAFTYMMDLMIGREAYDALVDYDGLTKDQFAQVVQVVQDTLLGPLELPKAGSPNGRDR